MKIAFISFDFGEYTVRHASVLAEKAVVALFAPKPMIAPHLSELNPNVQLYAHDKPRLRQLHKQVATILTLVRQVKAFEPDVIHFQHGHLWFNMALPLLRRYPLVVTVHDPQPHVGDRDSNATPAWLMHSGYSQADQLIVHARQVKSIVVEKLKFPQEIVHVVPHIALGNHADHSEVQEEPNTLLFFGRIWEYKGLEYLIRAEPLISEQIPDVRIVIAGTGEDMDRYRRMMVHPEKFELHNEYIADADIAKYFRRSSIVVLPYIEATQSGIVPIAYNFSRPVVATRVGGLPDLVEDGQTGLLIPPRDEKALADAIVRLLKDRNACAQMGKNGKQKLDAECSPDAVGKQTFAVYQKAIRSFHAQVGKQAVQYSQ